MAFEDLVRKIAQKSEEKPRLEIVDQTLDLGMKLTGQDYIEKIKKIKELKKILKDVDSMNLYKRGWRFQFGTSKEWAGLCSAAPSSVYESKKNKNLFVSLDIVKGDDNWKDSMKSTIYHEIAHAIVREIFYYPDSPSNISALDKIDTLHLFSKGHGVIWLAVCNAIKEKGVECTATYKNLKENDLFKNFRYICNVCSNKGYGNSKFFATRCSNCKSPIMVESNII
jgi:hypothetical protein